MMRIEIGENKTKRRIPWLDIIKGICAFFIVLSHSRPPIEYTYLYTPFFLSGFFFVSGFTFSPRENLKSFILHKIRTVLLPYWLFGTFNAVLACIADKENLAERLLGLLLSINRKNDDLWFIMCLFVMQVIFYILYLIFGVSKRRRGMEFLGLGSFILCICGYLLISFDIRLPFQLETALIMMPFMFIGFFWNRRGNALREKSNFCVLSCVIIHIIFCLVARNEVNVHAEQYSRFPIFILQAGIGVVVIALVAQALERTLGQTPIIKMIIFIGQNSFIYYALQSKVIRLFDLIYDHLPLAINKFVRAPLYAVLCCLVLAGPAIIINRYFPFMLGQKRKV